MGFGPFTIDSRTFVESTPGVYFLEGTTYDEPPNEFRVTGATRSQNGYNASVRRVVGKTIIDSGSPKIDNAVVGLTLSIPKTAIWTATEIDVLATDLATFVTVDRLDQILRGKS